MRSALALLIVLIANPAVAEECRFTATDGRSITFPENGYMTVRIGSDDLWCQAAMSETGGIVECPAGDGGTVESEVTFTQAGLLWDNAVWYRRCYEPA